MTTYGIDGEGHAIITEEVCLHCGAPPQAPSYGECIGCGKVGRRAQVVRIHPYDLFTILERFPLEELFKHDHAHAPFMTVDGVTYMEDTSIPFKRDLLKEFQCQQEDRHNASVSSNSSTTR